jgi:hypothetical protein
MAAVIRFENKVQHNICVRSAPKKTRSISSAGKVFWDTEGISLLIILKRVKQ